MPPIREIQDFPFRTDTYCSILFMVNRVFYFLYSKVKIFLLTDKSARKALTLLTIKAVSDFRTNTYVNAQVFIL